MKPFNDTSEIDVSPDLINQVVGQEDAVNIIKVAARQRRFVLLIGDPGTGKSMLGQALAQKLSEASKQATLLFHNKLDPNHPKVKQTPLADVKETLKKHEALAKDLNRVYHLLFTSVFLLIAVSSGVMAWIYKQPTLLFWGALLLFLVFWYRKKTIPNHQFFSPIVLFPVPKKRPAFIDATGFHEGGLLGDVRHDPYQSGGHETLPHLLVEAGAIHRANQGVLYIDEVSTLSIESQLSLLTAIQNKYFPITGRSSGSSGTMVQTEPVPCDFTLVIAGHKEDLEQLHPALRSRIKGYGYEIYMKSEMSDTPENRDHLIRFIAQEVRNDKKIPHLTFEAVQEIITIAIELSGKDNMITCRFRELGGVVRAAGDQAVMKSHEFVTKKDVLEAKKYHQSIEAQIG